MSELRRIVCLRHGETVGDSSVRFHGSSDVPLSDEGRRHARDASAKLAGEVFDLVVASPLRRSWESARIVAGGAPTRLEADFREIHFGRWEGLTAEEIQAQDPVLYQDWQSRVEGFEYPGGERRKDFRERVERGLQRMFASGARQALVVAHKGVIRAIGELLDAPLDDGDPPLGGIVSFTREPSGRWFVGRRGSNPPPLQELAG